MEGKEKFETEAYKEELKELKLREIEHQDNIDRHNKKRMETISSDRELSEMYNKMSRTENNKKYKVIDKINEIEEYGLSRKEMNKLKRELMNFETLEHSTNLGSRDRTVQGFSKTLDKKVKVSYTRYTSFMRNVRGCGSLAGQISIFTIEVVA